MLQSYLIIGSIIFLGIVIYSYKMRQRIYNNTRPCKTIFIPENRKPEIYTKELEKNIKESDLKKYYLREDSY